MKFDLRKRKEDIMSYSSSCFIQLIHPPPSFTDNLLGFT